MIPHILQKENSGETRRLSAQLKSEEIDAIKSTAFDAINRHKLLQSLSSCRYTHTEQDSGDAVSTDTSGKKTGGRFIDAAAFPSAVSACDNGRRPARHSAKLFPFTLQHKLSY